MVNFIDYNQILIFLQLISAKSEINRKIIQVVMKQKYLIFFHTPSISKIAFHKYLKKIKCIPII
jgi:hypothetical protein